MTYNLSNRLIQLRCQQKMTQGEVADKIGVTRGCVTNWEGGSREPRPAQLEKLSELFHVSVDYLLGRDAEQNFGESEQQAIYCPVLDISVLDRESRVAIIRYFEYLKDRAQWEQLQKRGHDHER